MAPDGSTAMTGQEIRAFRSKLALSRTDLARFLGVSEATVARWESADPITEPKGLQAILLQLLEDALESQEPHEVGRLVRLCGVDYRSAMRGLLGVVR